MSDHCEHHNGEDLAIHLKAKSFGFVSKKPVLSKTCDGDRINVETDVYQREPAEKPLHCFNIDHFYGPLLKKIAHPH